MVDAIAKVYSQEGIKGFYKGIIPSLILVSNGAIQFMTYEYLRVKVIQRHNEIVLKIFNYIFI